MMENTPVQQKVKCQLENYTENPQPYNLPIYNIKGIKIWYHRMSHEIILTCHSVGLPNLISFDRFIVNDIECYPKAGLSMAEGAK